MLIHAWWSSALTTEQCLTQSMLMTISVFETLQHKSSVEDLRKQGLTVKQGVRKVDRLSHLPHKSCKRQKESLDWVAASHSKTVQNWAIWLITCRVIASLTPLARELSESNKTGRKFLRKTRNFIIQQSEPSFTCWSIQNSVWQTLMWIVQGLRWSKSSNFQGTQDMIKFVLDTADYDLKIEPIDKPVGDAW